MVEYIVKESGYPGRLETENVGELIRCKNCKHFDVNGWCNYLETAMKPNDFCSRAEEGKEG